MAYLTEKAIEYAVLEACYQCTYFSIGSSESENGCLFADVNCKDA